MIDIFPISLAITLTLILLEKFSRRLGLVNIRDVPHTLHQKSTSRFGGIAIFLSLFIVSFTEQNLDYEFLRILLICCFPVFFMGILDDFKVEIKPINRIIIAFPSAFAAYYFLGTEAYSLDIIFIDKLFSIKFFSILFICFAISGMVNAFNMIDGINGLVLLYVLTICFLVILFHGSISTPEINLMFVATFFSVLGVFILNFPFGRIFLGDGGAYFLGIALSIGIIKLYQVNSFSPWYVLGTFIYPVTDVMVSIIRRIIAKISALEPDNKHLHHLIFRKISKLNLSSEILVHAISTIIIFILYTPVLLIVNYFPKETPILMVTCLCFIILYSSIYLSLTPKNFLKQ